VVVSRRALGNHQDRYPILIPLDRLANYLSRAVTVNSKAVWNDVVDRDRIRPEKLVLIYNGLDVSAYKADEFNVAATKSSLKIPKQIKVVIVIANLIPYKGHSDFLKAARIVVQKRTDICFLLVGEDRGIRKNLEAEVEDLSLESHVRFAGQRKDVPALLAASDLSVLPSHEEGFSNVILESMAAGLPVIATAVGGNAEAITNGVTGWLVPPRKPEIMAEKILDLLRDPNKAKQMGKEGQERVAELFSVEKMVSKHLNLYRSL
jgi:glycosyltransferase involved in cell wall biosynthesis